jgi:hypothetical protein
MTSSRSSSHWPAELFHRLSSPRCATRGFCGQLALENARLEKSVGQAPARTGDMRELNACARRSCPFPSVISASWGLVNRACDSARQHHTIEPAKLAEAVALRDAIEQIILDFPGYGYRRVTHAMPRDGWKVNHKRVLRIMREESLLCHLKRHVVQTTDSHHPYPISPNLVNGRTPDAPDVIWGADLTSIREAPRVCRAFRRSWTRTRVDVWDGICPPAWIPI